MNLCNVQCQCNSRLYWFLISFINFSKFFNCLLFYFFMHSTNKISHRLNQKQRVFMFLQYCKCLQNISTINNSIRRRCSYICAHLHTTVRLSVTIIQVELLHAHSKSLALQEQDIYSNAHDGDDVWSIFIWLIQI